jgi:hypothetical protein
MTWAEREVAAVPAEKFQAAFAAMGDFGNAFWPRSHFRISSEYGPRSMRGRVVSPLDECTEAFQNTPRAKCVSFSTSISGFWVTRSGEDQSRVD